MPALPPPPPQGQPDTTTTARLRAVTARPRGRRFAPAGSRQRTYAAAPPPASARRPAPAVGPAPNAPASYRADHAALPPWMRRTMEELGPSRPVVVSPTPTRGPRPPRTPAADHAPARLAATPLQPTAFAILCAAVLTAYAIGLFA